MTNSHSIQIHVTDHTYRPIEGALVSADDASAYTDRKGRAHLEIPDGTSIKVEARGYEGQARSIELKKASHTLLFTLGRAGMPYYYRGKVKVPFEPLPGTIGVLAKPENARDKKKSAKSRHQPMSPSASAASIIRSDKNFARSGIVVLRMEDGDDEALANRAARADKRSVGRGRRRGRSALRGPRFVSDESDHRPLRRERGRQQRRRDCGPLSA